MEALLARARGRSPSTEATPSERIPPTQELTLTEIEPNSPTAKMVLAEEGSMECSQVLPGPQGREENARRMLTDALAGLDWTHLRQYAQGWRFSPDDGGIRCSYGHLLTLRCVQLSASGSRGSLRFIALPRGCAGCPGRSTCIRPTSSVTAREVRLVVSGQEATHIKTLLARTRPGPSSSEVPSDAGIDPSQRD